MVDAYSAYSYQMEMLNPALEHEIQSMLNDYYEATDAKDGIPQYDYDWQLYETLQQMGFLLVTTARRVEDSILSGMAMYHVREMPHHRGMWGAECDGIAVAHTERGKGIGTALYHFTEPLLRERGVKRIINKYRTVYNARPIFSSLGFALEELVYIKRID